MKIPDWLPDTHRPVRPERGPRRPLIERLTQLLVRFMHVEAASGIVLLACTVLALGLANSPWSATFTGFWQTRLGFTVGGFALYKPLLLWINDGLMTVFFFLVGLEIKREFVFGELQDPRKLGRGSPGSGSAAHGRELEGTPGRGLPGGHRLHHVAVHCRAGTQGSFA